MEIELKYSLDDEAKAEEIKADRDINKFFIPDSYQVMDMSAVHFDTEDFLLRSERIAFRIRREGERNVATLKWGGGHEGSLHVRNELNINIGTGEITENPDISVFRESEIGQKVMSMVEGKKLVPLMKINVQRESWKIKEDITILEFCIDRGQVITDFGTDEIRELEVEIITGMEEVLNKYGDLLVEKYRLEPEGRSKFARGLALLGKDK
ncbi:MAG: CYTH domain-containing protein [Eubacterium sp.]|nr:CYTH domain-containing protein [Eubacterium sp.]